MIGYISDTETVGSIACADMLFRTNLVAMVGGGSAPRFDEKAGTVGAMYCHAICTRCSFLFIIIMFHFSVTS